MSNKRLTITFASIRHEDMKSFGTYEKARGLGNGGQSGFIDQVYRSPEVTPSRFCSPLTKS